MDIKGVIFDLDGVLCSTDRFHYAAWKELADSQGIPFDETINQRLRGVSRMQSLEIILEHTSREYREEEKQALAREKNQRYQQQLAHLTPAGLTKDARFTLEALRAEGLLLAVGSSSKNAPLILQRLGLENWFDAVADGNDIVRSKPNPEVFLLAAERLKLPAYQCLVVEDADAGIEAAINGNFQTAGLGPANKNPRAAYHLKNIKQLLNIIPDIKTNP